MQNNNFDIQANGGGKDFSRPRRILLLSMALAIVLTAAALCFLGAFKGEPYIYSADTKVLVYHLVSDETYGENEYLFVRPKDLEAQLGAIMEQGYETVFADELHLMKEKKCVVLTFDDGYADNFSALLPILEKYDMKATVFLITDMIGTTGHLSEAEIREMAESGYFHFGSHTVTHQKLSGQERNVLRREMSESRRKIEALTGQSVTAFAYPNGVYDTDAELAAKRAGYLYCFTTDAPREEFYENTRLPRSYVVRDMPMDEFIALIE